MLLQNVDDSVKKKELIYPFLLKCCDITDDIFWRNIFEDLSYGECPSGTFIYKGFLTCTQKGKEWSYKIEEKDPEILFNDIYDFLHNKTEIFSQKEREFQCQSIKKHYMELSDDSWSSIRKKNVKDLLIEQYILKMGKTYNLSMEKCKELLSVIYLGMIFKTITNKNIHYNNGEIESIDFIDFTDGDIMYSKNLSSIEITDITE